jgi:PKD repeat protein
MKKLLLFTCLLGCSSIINVSTLSAQKSIPIYDNKPYVEGELLIQTNSKGDIRRIVNALPSSFKVEILEEVSKPMRVWLIKFDHSIISHMDLQKQLIDIEGVTIVDYNYKVTMRATVPNDPQFVAQQWHHVNTGQTGGTVDADIDSDLAWDITTGGTSATNDDIVVCIIEGVNLNHTDLDPNKWVNPYEIANNGIDDDANGYIDDIYGWNPAGNNGTVGYGQNVANTSHGTNCAGMMGAVGNNAIGVAGANWDLKIMVVTVGNLTQANVISSYTYPLVQRQRWNNSNGAQGAFVVATSASWGIDNANPTSYPLWCNFYDTLGKYGIISVGATSNSNVNVDVSGDMPTACASQYMVGVGRTDHNDATAGGYGLTTIDFGAPGINVRTTANSNGYTTTTGTSFSCPLTAGVVGLAYSIPCTDFMTTVKSNPQVGANLVLQALWDGVDLKPQLATKFIHGGRLNSFNTLNELMAVACSGTLCIAPSGPTISALTNSTATLTWSAFSSADSYNLYWREVGATTWNTQNQTGLSFNFTGLDACSSYEYYLESVCDGTPSTAGSTQTFNTIGCGNCVDLAYCSSAATDAVDEWIQTVEIGSFINNSGNDLGYGNFTTGGSISMTKGQAYPITLTPDWGASQYNEQFRIWIDLNQNGTFETTELLYNQGAATQTPATGSITIPLTAVNGSTRMRIQMAYQGTGQTTLPAVCGNFTWGEVEDYCVEISSANICNYTISNTVVQPTCSGIDNGSITPSVSGGTSPYSYVWTNNASSSSISGLAAGTYSVTITDAASCDTTMNFSLAYNTTLNLTATKTDVTCNGLADGTAVASTTGSTGYTYAWSNGATTASTSGLVAGNYNVTVLDVNGCSANASVTINQPSPVQASFTTAMNSNTSTATFSNTSSPGSYSWNFDDGNTSTQTNPVHVFGENGTYNVCLTVTSTCGNATTCNNVVVFNTSSINESESILIEVYPNPTSNVLNIKNENPNATQFAVYDVNGKLIKTINLKNTITEVSVKELSNGMYFYQVLDNEGTILKTDKLTVVK